MAFSRRSSDVGYYNGPNPDISGCENVFVCTMRLNQGGVDVTTYARAQTGWVAQHLGFSSEYLFNGPFDAYSVGVAFAQQCLMQFVVGKRTDESTSKLERQILNNHPEDSNMREEITEAKDAAKRAVELAEGLHGRVDALEASNERQEASIGEVQAKLVRDHQRLGVLEHTLPPETVQALVEHPGDESDG